MMKQQSTNMVIFRNITLLAILICILTVSVIRKDAVLAQGGVLVESYSAQVETLNSSAHAQVSGYCTPGKIPRIPISILAWSRSSRRCENGRNVKNFARVEGAKGEPELIQTNRGEVIFNGEILGEEVGFTACSNVFFSFTLYRTETPYACWYQDSAPIDLGNIAGNYPPDFGGCDYCAANWMWTAACSGPSDRDYCGSLINF